MLVYIYIYIYIKISLVVMPYDNFNTIMIHDISSMRTHDKPMFVNASVIIITTLMVNDDANMIVT